MHYGAHYYAGRAAAVRNSVGAGQCIYLGTVLKAEGLREFLKGVLSAAGVRTLDGLPDSVEFTRRQGAGRSVAFYVNYSSESVTTPLASSGTDLLTDIPISGTLELGPFGVAIVQE
jgi:beta-galactosidase